MKIGGASEILSPDKVQTSPAQGIVRGQVTMKRRKFLKIASMCGGAAAIPSPWFFSRTWASAEEARSGGPIVFNQLGYPPTARKLMTLRAPSKTFSVRASAGGAV